MPTLASVKRRIPSRSSSQKGQQRQEKATASPVPQAPDLRRLSDFVNPFPHVGYGGYTKYYQAKQTDFPEIWSLNNAPPPQKQPQQQQTPILLQPSRPSRTSTRDSISAFARPGQSRNRRLSDIPESPSEAVTPCPSSTQLRTTSSTSSSQSKTLRRSQRRVIRAASTASTHSSSHSRNASSTTLDRSSSSSRSVMTSTTSSSTTNVSSYFDRAASTESHSTSPTDESESVLTPTDEQSLDAHYHVALKGKAPAVPVAVARPRVAQRAPLPSHLRPSRRPMKTYVPPSDESDFDTDNDSDDDPVDWRATFYTAKSTLSDM